MREQSSRPRTAARPMTSMVETDENAPRDTGGTGGFDKRPDITLIFQEQLDRKFECPVCCNVLRFPVQFEDCGHRCCSACIPELLRVAPECPLDGRFVDREKIYVDKAFQREIDNLGMKCSNIKNGCKWSGVLRDLGGHLDDCKYMIVECPNRCGAEVEKRHVQKHMDRDCGKRDMKCEFCSETITYEEEIDHLNTCKKFLVPCPNGCKSKEIPREDVEEHLAKFCTKQKATCPFQSAGCEFKGERKEIDKHCDVVVADHLNKLCNLVGEIQSQILLKQKEEKTNKFDDIVGRIENLEKLYGSQLLWKIDKYSQKLQEAKNGTRPTLFSPAFMTSRNGYKLALSACLYGDGKVRGKFMSIFVCLCRGEYDALLLWPFQCKITFTLLDQTLDPEARRNISYLCKPNVCKENKPFLGRPIGDRNASFGAQKFCELAMIESIGDYIRDDTIFIKVDVDLSDSPSV